MDSRKEDNSAAGLQLSRVLSIYDSGSYLEAIEGRQGTNIIGLKKIVEDYSGTENGEIAKIYLANSYCFLGKLDDAVKYYEDYSGSNDIFKATALSGEAGYYASKNEYEKAADLYRQASLVSEENVLNSEYMLQAGINSRQGIRKKQKNYLKPSKKIIILPLLSERLSVIQCRLSNLC
jgi:tetratricopeptide (TPR) repeat protein